MSLVYVDDGFQSVCGQTQFPADFQNSLSEFNITVTYSKQMNGGSEASVKGALRTLYNYSRSKYNWNNLYVLLASNSTLHNRQFQLLLPVLMIQKIEEIFWFGRMICKWIPVKIKDTKFLRKLVTIYQKKIELTVLKHFLRLAQQQLLILSILHFWALLLVFRWEFWISTSHDLSKFYWH